MPTLGTTRPGTLCQNTLCRRPYSEHLGEDTSCPGLDTTFRKHVSRVGASQSFSKKEVRVMVKFCQDALSGQLNAELVRLPEFRNVMAKFHRMKKRVEDMP